MSTSTDVPAESSVAAAVPMDVDEQPEASGDAVMSAEKKLEFGDECYLDFTFQPEGLLSGLNEQLTDVDLTGNRLKELPDMRILSRIQRLVLQENELASVEPLVTLTTLTDLDLYGNQLKTCGGFAHLVNLTRLDLSFNAIRVIEGLDSLSNLKELYLVNNKVAVMQNLGALSTLRTLELGSNRIREIACVESLGSLTHLWLGRNKITSLPPGLSALHRLELLALSSNRLASLDGLPPLPSLKELHVSHNGLSSLLPLQPLTSLHTLDVGTNQLEEVSGLEGLTGLEELWCGENRIASFSSLRTLSPLQRLQTVYFERNPIQEDAQYTVALLSLFPSLTQVTCALGRRTCAVTALLSPWAARCVSCDGPRVHSLLPAHELRTASYLVSPRVRPVR